MKKILWIFLIVGVLAGIWFFLRKKEVLAGIDVIEPEPDIAMDTGITLPVLPGTDIPVGLRPRPGNGITAPIYTPLPMPMPIPISLPSWAGEFIAKKEIGDFIRAEIILGKGFILPPITKEQIKARVEQLSPFASKIIGKLGL